MGIDNVFILVSSTYEQFDDLAERKRVQEQKKIAFQMTSTKPTKITDEEHQEVIGRVTAEAGPSMLLSTLAQATSFLLGSLSPMPAVRAFSLYAAVALSLNFVLQVCLLYSN